METIYRLYKNVGNGLSENILDAVMKNDCAFIIKYYEDGHDIKVLDNKKESLLHKACRNDYFEVVDLLIKLGVDINQSNIYGDTPLHLAVQFKNGAVVDKLLFEGARVNAQNLKKVSPLHVAAARGKEDILNLLVIHKAKLNMSDENGAKPIHYGVMSGKTAIIRNLLNNGGSLNEGDDRKNNVLHYACEKGDVDLIAYVLRHITFNDSRNLFLETPLYMAAGNCKPTVLAMLLEKGYDIDAVNINGQTPLDIAILKQKVENADYLREFKRSTEYREHYLKYPLHRAACSGNYEYLTQTVNSENINDFDYFGKNLMYYAINSGSLKIVDFLYRHGCRIDVVDEHNQSALLIAMYNEHYPMIEYLLKKKANVNEIFYGRSYLYRAILRNNYEIAKLLVDYGADVNYIDNRHRTIFSYAIDYASDEIIDLLVTKKASFV